MRRVGLFVLGILAGLTVTLFSVLGGLLVLLFAMIGLIVGVLVTKHKMVEQDFARARTLNEMLRAGRGITHRSLVEAGVRPLLSGRLELLSSSAIFGFLIAVLISDFPWWAGDNEVVR